MRGSSRAVAGRILSWTAKMYWNDRPEHEHRDRDADERDHGHEAIAEGLRAPGRIATERDAEAGREEEGGEGQLDRAREAGHEPAQDRPVVDEAVAQVAMGQVVHVDQVLLPERQVQPEPMAKRLDELGPLVLAEDGLGRIAGQEVDEGEQDEGQPEQHRDRPEESPDDVPQHPLASSARIATSADRRRPPMWIMGGRIRSHGLSGQPWVRYWLSQTDASPSVRFPGTNPWHDRLCPGDRLGVDQRHGRQVLADQVLGLLPHRLRRVRLT